MDGNRRLLLSFALAFVVTVVAFVNVHGVFERESRVTNGIVEVSDPPDGVCVECLEPPVPCVDCGWLQKPEVEIAPQPLDIFPPTSQLILEPPSRDIEVPEIEIAQRTLGRTTGLQRPEYPQSCRDRGVSGRVLLEFDVTPEGNVANARIIESSDDCFDAAALRMIAGWRYPSSTDDQGRPTWRRGVREIIRYELVE